MYTVQHGNINRKQNEQEATGDILLNKTARQGHGTAGDSNSRQAT
jgi:hypothetical protein